MPFKNTSLPRRIGTRTNETFLNRVGLFFCSIILEIISLMAFEPISIAAYFNIFKLIIVFF